METLSTLVTVIGALMLVALIIVFVKKIRKEARIAAKQLEYYNEAINFMNNPVKLPRYCNSTLLFNNRAYFNECMDNGLTPKQALERFIPVLRIEKPLCGTIVFYAKKRYVIAPNENGRANELIADNAHLIPIGKDEVIRAGKVLDTNYHFENI